MNVAPEQIVTGCFSLERLLQHFIIILYVATNLYDNIYQAAAC